MEHLTGTSTIPSSNFFGDSITLNRSASYSLEREEAEDLIKRHGGRVTGSISKKTVSSLETSLAYLLFLS